MENERWTSKASLGEAMNMSYISNNAANHFDHLPCMCGGVQIPSTLKIDEWNPMASEEEWMENTKIWKA